jgi:dinuclear metal center YbgI/SA1388 family protein
MLIKELAKVIEKFAPLELQEHYDNAGLIIGNRYRDISKVLVCLDVTDSVVDEAIDLGCDLIISHHPLIFLPLKKINSDSIIYAAIRNDIAVYAAHTNLDSAEFGVSRILAEKLGLKEVKPLRQNASDPKTGLGAIGELLNEVALEDFLDLVKNVCNIRVLRHSGCDFTTILKVALCGGAGEDLIKDATAQFADAYITADLKYHHFNNNDLLIVDAGHYETEQYAVDILYDLLTANFTALQVYKTNNNTNFIKYH